MFLLIIAEVDSPGRLTDDPLQTLRNNHKYLSAHAPGHASRYYGCRKYKRWKLTLNRTGLVSNWKNRNKQDEIRPTNTHMMRRSSW